MKSSADKVDIHLRSEIAQRLASVLVLKVSESGAKRFDSDSERVQELLAGHQIAVITVMVMKFVLECDNADSIREEAYRFQSEVLIPSEMLDETLMMNRLVDTVIEEML